MNHDSPPEVDSTLPPPSLRDRWKANTRQAILQAAEIAFAEAGLQQTRMEQIAAAAGVAVGTLYNYFPSRQALVDALIDAYREELLAALDALPTPTDLPLADRLAAFLHVVVAHVERHHGLLSRLLQADALPGQRSALPALRERAERLLAQAERQGLLQPAPAGLHAVLLVGMLRAALGGDLRAGRRTSGHALVEPLVDVFLHGAARPHAPEAR